MKKSHLFPVSPYTLLSTLLLAVFLLSACSSGPGESWAGVSQNLDTGTIYVSYDQHITALNPTSGAIQWRYGNKSTKFFAPPVVKDGIIYVGDYQGRMHAINAETGAKVWVYTPKKDTLIGPISLTAGDRVISGVAIDSNLVFFGMGSRNVEAVSRETGQRVWTFKTNHGVWATPLYIPANPDDPKSVAVLYAVSLDHHLYAINPETGKELWNKNLGGAIPGTPIYDKVRNRLYVGTFVSEMVAVDLASHQIVARFKTDNWVWGGPVMEDGILYFGDLDGSLYAVRVTDEGFKQIWKASVSKKAIRSTPLLAGDMVIVTSKDEHIYALGKADGSSRWSQNTKSPALTDLVLVPASTSGETTTPAMVVAGTDDKGKLLIAYALDNGDEKWHYAYKN